MTLAVGCAMWAHKAWPGHLMPRRAARERPLAAYATWCTAVEGNTTFYGTPSLDTVRTWAEQMPTGFRFVPKLPREITHERRLRHADTEVTAFLRAMDPLGDRLHAVSVQLASSFGPGDLPVLATFLDALPRHVRTGVEVRHPRFFDGSAAAGALERMLADRGAEWIVFDTTPLFASPPQSDAEREGWADKPRLARRTDAVTDAPIVRYIGRDDPAATVAGWQPWLPVVARWLTEGRRPTFFVHTPDNRDAPALARRFHDAVRALVPSLAALPTPDTPEQEAPATLF